MYQVIRVQNARAFLANAREAYTRAEALLRAGSKYPTDQLKENVTAESLDLSRLWREVVASAHRQFDPVQVIDAIGVMGMQHDGTPFKQLKGPR